VAHFADAQRQTIGGTSHGMNAASPAMFTRYVHECVAAQSHARPSPPRRGRPHSPGAAAASA